MKELDGSLFKSFIDLEDNHRMIFSAKFGAGKTYFLKSFFKKDLDSYEAVFLYPVNYQVCANEDIFEFVLHENKLDPTKTLFIDDTEQHILGAQKVGIHTFHLQKGESICDVLKGI